MNLEKINSTSLTTVTFLQKPILEIKNNLDFFNIVFAENGMFVVMKNDLLMTITKLPVKYSNSALYKLEPSIYCFVPKPPLELFCEILEIFKYVNKKSKKELCVNLYYNKVTRKFELNIVNQEISEASVRYEYDPKFEQSDRFIRYLQIHSHNTLKAGFSSVDNEDESYQILCYYGVVGRLSDNTFFYNVDMQYRIWNGINFTDVAFSDVFDIKNPSVSLEESTIRKLNDIIEISKKGDKELFDIEKRLWNWNNRTNYFL